MNKRLIRIEEEIKREICDIITNDLKDPRLKGLISITKVSVSKDLSHGKVYASILGTDEEASAAMVALKSSAGYIRREVGQRIKIRTIPELVFVHDHSIEQGSYLSNLIEKTIQDDAKGKINEQEENS